MTMNCRLSFEFFPPKTDKGRDKLQHVISDLGAYNPEFFSVTYGAGGSTRDGTQNTITEVLKAGYQAAPHLSFGGDDEAAMEQMLNDYKNAGVKRIVALRGDVPSGSGAVKLVYANELVEFIRKTTGDHFHIEVAAYPEIHPESDSFTTDLNYFKAKIDAGANSAITQYFFNVDAYFYYVDQCQKQGIEAPIYPGIMPVTNYESLIRFSSTCGAEIPRWVKKRLESLTRDQQALLDYGEELVSDLCQRLLDGGAPGIHFYTLNQSAAIQKICDNLGFSRG
ncbi:MAG: methylenetetrahydrofolate reductase [NAD(P)H] [Pseudomonadales bacterium]|nr:methylenetetrahydrofolate reductase [NAD(P)H] [Pseudomonadales bacterium]